MLIDELIEHLHRDEDETVRQEALLHIAHVFEKWQALERDLVEEALRHGWSRGVVEGELQEDAVRRLADTVRNAVGEDDLSDSQRAIALWALGRRLDPELAGFFRTQAAWALEEESDVVLWQAMKALAALGEDVFWGGTSTPSEADLNRLQAREYLERTAPDQAPEDTG